MQERPARPGPQRAEPGVGQGSQPGPRLPVVAGFADHAGHRVVQVTEAGDGGALHTAGGGPAGVQIPAGRLVYPGQSQRQGQGEQFVSAEGDVQQPSYQGDVRLQRVARLRGQRADRQRRGIGIAGVDDRGREKLSAVTVSYPDPAGSTTSHGRPSAVSWMRMFRMVRAGAAPALPVTRTPWPSAASGIRSGPGPGSSATASSRDAPASRSGPALALSRPRPAGAVAPAPAASHRHGLRYPRGPNSFSMQPRLPAATRSHPRGRPDQPRLRSGRAHSAAAGWPARRSSRP